MKYFYKATCKIHGEEIGGGDTPKECEANAYSPGCDIEVYSLFAANEEVNAAWEREHAS